MSRELVFLKSFIVDCRLGMLVGDVLNWNEFFDLMGVVKFVVLEI